MKAAKLPIEVIEREIQMATKSRECPATGKECNIPDFKGAESLRTWAEYIQKCSISQSREVFTTIDKDGFVDCCQSCNVYKDYCAKQSQR
jgi:hypothetical protein